MFKTPLTLDVLVVSFLPVLLFSLYTLLSTRKLRSLNKTWYLLLVVQVLMVYGVPTILNFSSGVNGIRTALYGDFYNILVRTSQIKLSAKLPLDVAYCPISSQNYPLNTSILIATVSLFSGCEVFTSTKTLAFAMFICTISSIALFSKLFFLKNRLTFSLLLTILVLFGGNLFWLRLIPVYTKLVLEKGLEANFARPYWALHFEHDPRGHLGPTCFLFELNKAFSIPLILLGIYMFIEGLRKEDLRRSLISGILGTFILGSHPYAFISYGLGLLASLLYPSKYSIQRRIDISLKSISLSMLASLSTITYWIHFFPETSSTLQLYQGNSESILRLTTWSLQSIRSEVTSLLLPSLERWGVYFFLLTVGIFKMRRFRKHYWLAVWLISLFLFYIVDPFRLKAYTLRFASLPLYFMSCIVLTEVSTESYEKIKGNAVDHKGSPVFSSTPSLKGLLISLVLFSSILNSLFLLPMYTASSLITFHPWTEIRSAYWLSHYSPRTAVVLEPDFLTGQTIVPIFAHRRVLIGPWDHFLSEYMHLKPEVYGGVSPLDYYDELVGYGVDFIFIQSDHKEALDEILAFPKFNLIYNNQKSLYIKI